MNLKNISIRTKIYVSFAIVAILCLVMAILGITHITQLDHEAHIIQKEAVEVQDIMQLKFLVEELEVLILEYALEADEELVKKIQHEEEIILVQLDKVEHDAEELNDDYTLEMLDVLRVEIADFFKEVEKVEHLVDAGEEEAVIYEIKHEIVPQVALMDKQMDEAVEHVDENMRKHIELAEHEASVAKTQMIVSTIIIFLLAIGIGFFTATSILKPVRAISKEAEELGQTVDFSKRFSVLANDEIGKMAASLNKMVDEVNIPVSEMKDNFEKIAAGDLTVQNNKEAKGDILHLRNSVDKMVDSMSTLLTNVKKQINMAATSAEELSASSEEVNSATEQVNVTIQEVAKAGQDLATLSAETKAAVEDVAKASKQVTQRAQEASDGAVNAGQAAQSGMESGKKAGDVMQQIMASSQSTAEKITNLDESSKEIGKIIDVIDNISEQTNLLALNAAIEAARAGEAGRGFAVVADEVRKLAEESQRATTQIADMINSIQDGTKESVKDMTQAGEIVKEGSTVIDDALKSLNEIATISKDVQEQVQAVVTAAHQSDDGVAKISKSVQHVSATSEESAASTEEVSASMQETASSMHQVSTAAQNLSNGADELRQLLAKFKLKEQ